MQNSQYISPIRGIIAKNPNNLQFSSLKPKDEPYRRLLMAVRRRCYRTKVSMEAQYLGDSAELLLERHAFGTYIYIIIHIQGYIYKDIYIYLHTYIYIYIIIHIYSWICWRLCFIFPMGNPLLWRIYREYVVCFFFGSLSKSKLQCGINNS